MAGYHYLISVTDLDDVARAPLAFESACHDDMLAIVERLRGLGHFENDEAAALAVGLKLLGEVVLAHRKDPLFAPLAEDALGDFIKRLKAAGQGKAAASAMPEA